MRCLVLVLLAAPALAAAAGVPCALAGDFLQRHNVTADDDFVSDGLIFYTESISCGVSLSFYLCGVLSLKWLVLKRRSDIAIARHVIFG
ncbi:hypothetical protein B5X24_HaOG201515 [Helicoverpa armigera]|nr:hypothetical protein B5X24_HaOG201515 [Helicoverpa armigera]